MIQILIKASAQKETPSLSAPTALFMPKMISFQSFGFKPNFFPKSFDNEGMHEAFMPITERLMEEKCTPLFAHSAYHYLHI